MHVSDLIEINATQTDAAVVLDRSIASPNLVACFAPTRASTAVLAHLQKAVLPEATQEMRAINLFGNYGSGKSHLAVLIAQMFRDGAGSGEFTGFFQRLGNAGHKKLAEDLRHTFLAEGDPDAKPYLLVTLYGSETPSLAAKLYEGLYQTLTRHPELNPKALLPKTEYDVCIQRFEEIVEKDSALTKADLVQWHLAEHYLTTAEMQAGLKRHEPQALGAFKRWHEEVCKGAAFNPVSHGGKNFIEAYQEAGKNLADHYGFGGILVVWDEFGFALEDLLNNQHRHAYDEIMALQAFVETVCKPSHGHTVFMGLTHVSFVEYAARTGANETIKNRLETIAGRFHKPFKMELNAAESEGYHLLAMQKAWTLLGEQYWQQADVARQMLLECCAALPLFKSVGPHLAELLKEVYPLHPVMAAGLFALSDFAQSNRTALTFFRDNEGKLLAREIHSDALLGDELVRLPALVDYYADSLKEKAANDWNRYQRALARIPADLPDAELQAKHNILKLLLLAQLLGDNFQASELFLACALYDAKPNTSMALKLGDDLAWLKAVGLVWKNDVTGEWLLHGEASADVEKLIPDKLGHFAGRSAETLFNDHPDMLADVLPMIGIHDLEPSVCGIVRSYQVSLLTPPISNQLKLDNLTLSAKVFLVLAETAEDVGIVKSRIAEMKLSPLYFWLPAAGIYSETVTNEDRNFNLTGLLCRYLVLQLLLKEKTASDDVRRQLTAKWEKNRQDLVQILRQLFGRDGLTVGKCSIHQAGTTNAIVCNNWHEFRGLLAEQVQVEYSQEIPVRANNMNRLNNEKYTGRSDVRKIVERILDFATHPAYQTDLLGNAETSEPAALIDGVLGVNQLFIERPTGWDIRKIDETDGKVKEVLKLLRGGLLHKREQPYLVKELRDKLVAPPFGLPACTLALFAAVAVRDDVKRLRWGSTSETDFATNLTEAFNQDSKLTIRLFEFSTKQLAILSVLSHYFKLRKRDSQSYEEFAIEVVSALRKFINEQPDAVKNSGQLHPKTKELVNFLKQIGKSQQDVAEFLLKLVVLDHASENTILNEGVVKLKELLDDFERISHAKQHELKQTVQSVLPNTPENKSRLIANLNHDSSNNQAKAFAQLLEEHGHVDEICPGKITQVLLNKPIEECTETEIGRCQGKLEALVEHHQHSPQVYPPTSQVAEPITTKQQLVLRLQKYILGCGLAKDDITAALRTVLADYE